MKIIFQVLEELAKLLAPLALLLGALALCDVTVDWLLGVAVAYLTGAIVREFFIPRVPPEWDA